MADEPLTISFDSAANDAINAATPPLDGSHQLTIDWTSIAPSSGEGGGFDLGEFGREIVVDTIEGAVAPVKAAISAGRAILADPMLGVLPAGEQEEDWGEAGKQAVKGAAFWGSMLVGGRAMGMVAKPLWKMAVAGATGAGTFETINKLPEFMSGEIQWPEYTQSVATAATFGGVFGGVLGAIPGGSKFALRQANKMIDSVPGGAKIRNEITGRIRETITPAWHKFTTSGEQLLKKAGLEPLAVQLRLARSTGAMTGGRFVAGFLWNTKGMKAPEFEMMGTILDQVNFRNPISAPELRGLFNQFADGVMPEAKFVQIFGKARNEAKRLRKIGDLLQKSGIEVYDPVTDQFHTFMLRDMYLPHRFNNPEAYRVGGKWRQAAIDKVGEQLGLYEDDAANWIDRFADRIQAEMSDYVDRRTASVGASHYLQGRSIGLPGYELNVSKVLPQYYEHAGRRLANHAVFGRTNAVEDAVRTAQTGMFSEAEMRGLVRLPAQPNAGEQIGIDQILLEGGRGRGMKRTLVERPERVPKSAEEAVRQRRNEGVKDAMKAYGIEMRYPRAFDQLKTVEDPQMKAMVTNIVRRQLGGLDPSPYGEKALSRLAKLEVVTKLALGAIAQPSQMLSAVVRTGWTGSFKNFLKVVGGDPEAIDFAIRSGVLLKGVVRQSEQSLTAKGQDFLERVYFTQLDLKSRVFGALQGASFAEHQSRKLAMLAKRFPMELRPTRVANQMAKIEQKLTQLGLDPADIVRRGGYLTEKQLLKAGQTVSGDVNFWGDSLALPEYMRSPYGRYVTQFKSFGFQQSKLIKDHVIAPMRRGDFGPAIRFAMITPLGGEIIADLKGMLRARKKRFSGEQGWLERVWENIANAAGFGLVADGFEATKYGMSGSFGLMAGPIGGTVAKTMTATGDLVRGQPKKAGQLIIETGLPGLAAVAFPPVLPLVAAGAPALSNLLISKE